jgi:hypothetical protein
LITILLCLPVLVLGALRSAPNTSRSRRARPRRADASASSAASQVGEFDFAHAMDAYEALIDSASREPSR